MKKTIKDYELKNKKVLIRCDFNVPIEDGVIVDDNRIVQSLQTIKYAIDAGAKVILMSHLGKIKNEEDKLKNSLKVVSIRLSELLNKQVIFVPETRGESLEDAVNDMNFGDVMLVENTRFEDFPSKLESKNDENLGKYWASLCDIFINDAFGTSHRSHASNVGIAKFVNSGIGFLIEKELHNLSVLENVERPYVVILGGAKISDKIEVVSSLVDKADKILIGGGMAFTFLKSKGYEIGKSICDDESLDFAKSMLDKYSDKIILSCDVKVTREFVDNDNYSVIDVTEFDFNDNALDIGPKTIELFKQNLCGAKTVFWNGTLGYTEFSNYANGTRLILDYITQLDTTVVLGGGDTVAASKVLGYYDKVSYASTGGGATLEYISGKKLPGIEAIDNR